MEINEEHRRMIDEIIAWMYCDKDFICRKNDFQKLGRVRIFDGGEEVDCMEPDSEICQYKLRFGDRFLCSCPVRQYLAKNLGI